MKFIYTFFFLSIITILHAQQSSNITFPHAGKTVRGTITVPSGAGAFPIIIINPGSGANDRDGTLPMLGANVSCLYPNLLNDTLRPYKELADALVAAGYAVLRYDKLEYTYPSSLGTITFKKLWLPVESAIDFVKTRNDVDTNNIILIGHSEGSSLIPFIAKERSDVKALISIAGPRTPFDSILAYQIVHITQTCNGNVSQAQAQANQILNYFNTIRTNSWNANTPALFGAPASAWYDYVRATDSVSVNYNLNNLPTLFLGMGLDINVPPAELVRFQNEVTITNDFWSLPNLNHYMTTNNDPHVSEALTDTIIYWLSQNVLSTGSKKLNVDYSINLYPNPFDSDIAISFKNLDFKKVSYSIYDISGKTIISDQQINFENGITNTLDLDFLNKGMYYLHFNVDGKRSVEKIVKE